VPACFAASQKVRQAAESGTTRIVSIGVPGIHAGDMRHMTTVSPTSVTLLPPPRVTLGLNR